MYPQDYCRGLNFTVWFPYPILTAPTEYILEMIVQNIHIIMDNKLKKGLMTLIHKPITGMNSVPCVVSLVSFIGDHIRDLARNYQKTD